MPAPRKFKTVLKDIETPKSGAATKEPPLSKAVTSAPTVIRQCDITRKDNTKEFLKAGWSNIGRRTLEYLSVPGRLEALLQETKLRDIGIFAGIATEKILLLEGQPTQIIGQPQQAQLDKLGQALADVMKQRGLVKLAERTAEIRIDSK